MTPMFILYGGGQAGGSILEAALTLLVSIHSAGAQIVAALRLNFDMNCQGLARATVNIFSSRGGTFGIAAR